MNHELKDTSTSTPLPLHMDEFIHYARRLLVPNYENALQFFSQKEIQDNFNDANEIFPYTQKQLLKIKHMASDDIQNT